MNTVTNFILYFFIYSFLGWLLEVFCKFFEEKKFVNRGFLLGPICPIYGYCVVLMILLIGTGDKDILSIFLKSILVCSIIEYSTSYIMEKVFKARWWDYSNKRFNINGRVCLETMLPFGILGTLALYFLQPNFSKFVSLFSFKVKLYLTLTLLLLYLLDNAISFKVMKKIKIQIKKQKEDNTSVIKKQVTDWINEHSFLYKHIIKAFPHFKIIDKVKNLVSKTVNKE